MQPTISISDIMEKVKSNSSKWINDNKFVLGKFNWQVGYSAFSYSRNQRNNVIQYIINQEQHHKSKTFKDEYYEFLRIFEIDYNEKYLYEFYE